MYVKVMKQFAYAADGIHTSELKVGDVVEIDPARYPGLHDLGLVDAWTGPLPANQDPNAPQRLHTVPDPATIPPRSANADGTSKVNQAISAGVRQRALENPSLTEAELKAKADAKAKLEADAKAKAEPEKAARRV